MAQFSKAVEQSSALQVLDFDTLTVDALSVLLDERNIFSLQTLIVKVANIDEECATSIFELLSCNPDLKALELKTRTEADCARGCLEELLGLLESSSLVEFSITAKPWRSKATQNTWMNSPQTRKEAYQAEDVSENSNHQLFSPSAYSASLSSLPMRQGVTPNRPPFVKSLSAKKLAFARSNKSNEETLGKTGFLAFRKESGN